MPRFVIHISEKKRRKDLLWGSLYIALGFFCLAMLIYYLFVDAPTMRRAFYICFAIQFTSSGYSRLKEAKRKEFFLEIDEDELTWIMQQTGKPMNIEWNDIRWLKKTRDEGILIFRESSFSVGFSLANFREEDKMQILSLIEQYAAQRKIRMINFSTPALVPA